MLNNAVRSLVSKVSRVDPILAIQIAQVQKSLLITIPTEVEEMYTRTRSTG